MKCTAYFEENELIPYDKYEKAMRKLSVNEDEGIRRDVITRKANFNTYKECTENNGRVSFSIVMKDFLQSEIYLEKKKKENGLVFKSFVKISRKEAEKILNGQLQWMKFSKSGVIRDFYLESDINKLEIVSICETKKDVCTQVRGLDGIVFKYSIRSTDIGHYDEQFFDEKLPMIDVINCDNVLYSYHSLLHLS